jgi:hypothetical protein
VGKREVIENAKQQWSEAANESMYPAQAAKALLGIFYLMIEQADNYSEGRPSAILRGRRRGLHRVTVAAAPPPGRSPNAASAARRSAAGSAASIGPAVGWLARQAATA